MKVASIGVLAQGQLAEIIVIKNIIKNGLPILVPYGNGAPYDLVIRTSGGSFITVQVKKVYQQNYFGKRLPAVDTIRKQTGASYFPYKKGDFDLLIACDINTEDCWLLPFDLISVYKRRICLVSPQALKYQNNWDILKG